MTKMMEKSVRVTLRGEALELVERLKRQGLSEDEIIGKALRLLRMATESRVVQVDEKGNPVGTLSVYSQYQQMTQMRPPDK